jgi:hypothetical protein
MFADDTNITESGNCMDDIESAVNSDLERLRKWLMANKSSLNVAKTDFQLIGTKHMLKKISDKSIKQVFQCKTLGITVDENLSWISNSTESIYVVKYHQGYALKQIKTFVDIKTLISVYNALIQPYSTVAIVVKYGMYLIWRNPI